MIHTTGLGKNFAQMEMRAILANVFHRYSFTCSEPYLDPEVRLAPRIRVSLHLLGVDRRRLLQICPPERGGAARMTIALVSVDDHCFGFCGFDRLEMSIGTMGPRDVTQAGLQESERLREAGKTPAGGMWLHLHRRRNGDDGRSLHDPIASSRL